MEEVNDFLFRDGGFTERLNVRFTVPPREIASSAVVLPTDTELAQRFTIDNTRTVRNDYTVHLDKIAYQLSRKSAINHGAKVIIKRYLDGNIAIFAGKVKLEYQILTNYVKPIKKAKVYIPFAPSKPYIPPAAHPFRKYRTKPNKQVAGTKQLLQLGDYYG